MFKPWIKSLFQPHATRSPQESYQFNVLVVILLLFTSALLILMLQGVVNGMDSNYFISLLIYLGVMAVCGYFVHRDRLDTASWLLVVSVWFGLAFGSYLSNGLYASSLMFFTLLLILTVLLLGLVRASFITLLTLGYVVLLYLVEVSGYLPPAPFKNLPFRVIILTIVFVSVVLFVGYHVYFLDKIQERNTELHVQEERYQVYSRLTQDLVHDLRTPVTVLKTDMYLLRTRHDRDLPLDETLERLESETNRLHNMIEDLNALMQLEIQKSEMISWHMVDVADVFQSVIAHTCDFAQSRQIDIRTDDIGHGAFQVAGSQLQIYQALSRLVENAILYGKPGGYVHLSVSQPDADWIHISVKDDGIGIPAEEHEKIFERFYRVDDARTASEKSGSGVGLSIVKSIVDLHNGSIQMTSSPGTGTTLTLILPASPLLLSNII